MADQPIIYTPKFQPPTWQDNVDLVWLEGPNGLDAQFKSLRGELDMLSKVVKQLSDQINSVNQTLSNLITSVSQTANAANNAASTANNAINTINTVINPIQGKTVLTAGMNINLLATANGRYLSIIDTGTANVVEAAKQQPDAFCQLQVSQA